MIACLARCVSRKAVVELFPPQVVCYAPLPAEDITNCDMFMRSKVMINAQMIPAEVIERRIYLLRGLKVMLDATLAELYGVETGALKSGSQTESRAIPKRLYVSADCCRNTLFEMPIWHLKDRPGWPPLSTLCFHGTRSSDAFDRPQQRARCWRQHRDYARVCAVARSARDESGVVTKTDGTGAQVRNTR